MTNHNPLIYGKNTIERIVSCEPKENHIELFIEKKDGSISVDIKPFNYWFLSNKPIDRRCERLDGDLHYKYILKFNEKLDFTRTFYNLKKNHDVFKVSSDKEMAMTLYGFTYFKNMTVDEISTLSFDIETTGVDHNKDSRVLMISNTFRRQGILTRKLFAFDDYTDEGEMIKAWCDWVREINPTILLGHNIYKFDLPYLRFVASKYDIKLMLGRDGSETFFNQYESKFRKDGSQFYHFNKIHIYGRELVDTCFLSIKFDIARKFQSYALKSLIKEMGLEKSDRQFYDASQIRFKYNDPVEWAKIKQYCEEDSDDALKLFDKFVGPTFYTTAMIPKSFTDTLLTNSGGQINALISRSYIQDGHSIPKGEESGQFQGAISMGVPGIYHNVCSADVESLYPSVILTYSIHDKEKDPKGHFLKILKILKEERIKNKKLAKDTGIGYYDDMQNSQKLTINSFFGMLGASGLNFNSPKNAALITEKGREILTKAVEFLTGKEFEVWKTENNLNKDIEEVIEQI